MHVSPAAEIAALIITVVVHFIGAGVLIWAMLDDEKPSWRALFPGDDDAGGGGGPPVVPAPVAPSGGGGLPLPETSPSPVRLRDAGERIGAGRGPARRPEHPREPIREPAER